MDSTVSYISGEDLYCSVRRSLELIEDRIQTKARVVVKPNFVTTRIPLSATEVDQVRAIVDFLRPKCDSIVIAESCAAGTAEEGFENYGYYNNLKDVEFVDLDSGEYEEVRVFDSNGHSLPIQVSTLLLDPDNMVVSAAKVKTHDTVVATLSAKNVIMCSMLEKVRMHQGYYWTNRNLVEVMKGLHIDLAVLDGINAMEGNGPSSGTRVNAGCVIASTDYVAADRVALEVMGIDPGTVGYLTYFHELGFGEYDLDRIRIVGDRIKRMRFRLHDCVEEQYEWRYESTT